MIGPRWRKILRDLWSNKSRTILVVISIAVGVAAIGMVMGTYSIITRDLPGQFEKVIPAHASLYLAAFDDEFIRIIKNVEGVKDAEGRRVIQVQMQVGPDEWKELQLTVIPNFINQSINKIFPSEGAWPPNEKELLFERSSLPLTPNQVGDTITIKTPSGITRDLKISGLAHDLNVPSGTFTNQANGFISIDTLEWLGFLPEYNQILLTTDNLPSDRMKVREVTYRVEDKIKKSGRAIFSTNIPDTDQHWFIPYLTPMAAVLTVMGLIILLISGFLIINTISAILSQQIHQIGIMKAVGAQTYQILLMYIFFMMVVGLFAFAIAVPLGWLGTRGSVNLIAGLINFDIVNPSLPKNILWIQGIISIFLPVVVALFPILNSSRITVREAISDYGLTKTRFGYTLTDRFLGAIRGFPRPLLLSLRNTFRKKNRLLLTLITLTLGTAIFISVMNVRTSIINTLEDALKYYGFDLAIFFNREYRVDQILNELNRFPEVDIAETWGIVNTRLVKDDNSESDDILLVAPPLNTKLIEPSVLEGRWLVPGDENAVVINTDVLKVKPELKIGDPITLKIDGVDSIWQIVGITRSVMTGPWIYTNYPYFARRLDRYGLSSGAYLSLVEHDPVNQQRMAKILQEHFDQVGLRVGSVGKVYELRAQATNQFNVIFLFLMIMSVLLTLVGGLGLMGTMSLNVIERTREIGVMRAIGASNGIVMQIVIVEGVLIGLMGWGIGLLLSIPLGKFLGDIIGQGFLRSPIIYSFSITGSLMWLLIITIISVISSFIPAFNANRLTVRDVLAYE